ncbi:jhy protein homolog [Aquarana catesbeiana]|uniref:jhy protein homolog n=1 Tax=Aquarana catesbeiana TaxID=8400 RepID=UPI003CC9862C
MTTLQLRRDPFSSKASGSIRRTTPQPLQVTRTYCDGVMDPNSLVTQAAYSRPDINLRLSLDSLEDSLEDDDSDSLSEERRYQSELQNRIHVKDNFLHIVNGESEDVQKDDMGISHQDHPSGGHNHSRAQAVETSYSELRYDPDWRRKWNLQDRSSEDEEDALDVSPRYSDLLSPEDPRHRPHGSNTSAVQGQNVTTLHSDAKSKITTHTTTQPAKHQSSNERTSHGRELYQNRTTTNKRADVEPQDAARKDFIEKNKASLGVRSQRNNSYLHLYKKNNDEISSDQNTGKPVSSESQPAIGALEMRSTAPTEEQISTDGRSKERRSKMTNMESRVLVRKDNMEFSFGQLRDEPQKTDSLPPERFRDLYLPPQEDAEIHTRSFVNWNMKPQELTLNGNLGVTAGDSFDNHYGFSQFKRQSLQDFSVTSPATHNFNHDTFLPEHNDPQKNSLSKDSVKSRDRESNTNNNAQQARKGKRVEEKNQKMLINYLKQDIKLGGIGPSYIISQEKKEQLKQQKEYAKIIREHNRNKPMKACEMPIVQDEDNNKGTRQKSLEYARRIPRPQQSPKASSEKQSDGGMRRAMSYDTLLPHNKLLEDLKARHEQEKVAVAALGALHII